MKEIWKKITATGALIAATGATTYMHHDDIENVINSFKDPETLTHCKLIYSGASPTLQIHINGSNLPRYINDILGQTGNNPEAYFLKETTYLSKTTAPEDTQPITDNVLVYTNIEEKTCRLYKDFLGNAAYQQFAEYPLIISDNPDDVAQYMSTEHFTLTPQQREEFNNNL